jgi:hypothetical protein
LWKTKRTPSTDHLLRRLVDDLVRRQDADRAIHHVLAQAGIDVALRRAFEVLAELVHRAPRHGGADQHVLAGGLLQKAFGGNHRHLALSNFLRRNHTERTAEMIDMAVSEDQRRNRARTEVLVSEGHRRRRALPRGQRIDDDPAALAFDQRDVRDVEAAQLVDALGHLEQAGLRVHDRVPPQAGIHGRRCLAIDKP